MQTSNWGRADSVALGVLAANDGVAKLSAFIAAGLKPHQVAAIFRRGGIHRPRNGWFADITVPWQGTHAIRVGGVLACTSAADSRGLPVPPESWKRLHVSVASNASRLRHNRDRFRRVKGGDDPEVELHWVDLVDPPVGWRTSLVDTLLQLVDCVPEEWFVAALDAALHRPWEGEPILSTTEFDREEFHDPEKDAIRDAFFRSLGHVVLRFSYERIVFDLEAVLDEIEAALALM